MKAAILFIASFSLGSGRPVIGTVMLVSFLCILWLEASREKEG